MNKNKREQIDRQNMQNSENVQRRTSETPSPFYERKRLSECIEEEDENPESAVSDPERKKSLTKSEPIKGKSTRVGKFFVTRSNYSENRNLHVDKKFFDDSLVEIRTPTKSADTKSAGDDYNILQSEFDNVWVKRSVTSSDSPENKTPTEDNKSTPTKTKDKPKDKDKPHKKDYAAFLNRPVKPDSYTNTIGYNSTNYGRRDSKDDPQLYQQTIHGTSGVSRRPAIFGVFRHKSKTDQNNADTKKATFMQQIKATFQGKGTPTQVISSKDGSAHPHGSSDVKYYHTVTASASPRRANPMHKVMDIFRIKPNNNQESIEQRSKRFARNQQTMAAACAKLKRMADHEKVEASKYRRGTTWITAHIPESYVDPKQSSIAFRNSRGLPVVSSFIKKSDEKIDEFGIYARFLRYHKCYDLIPTSAKLIVFDTKLLVKDAFYALVYNVIRAAPLWDSKRHAFVGMLTITDFIKVLQKYYKNPKVTIAELELHRLETWRNDLKDSIIPLVYITPDTSLFEATEILIKNKIHRLPIIDSTTGNVLHILTHRCILRFLFLYIKILPKPDYMTTKLRDLNIGTFDDIETVNEETLVIDALRKFVTRSISALPLVDSDGKLKDVYEKFDVLNLIVEKTYDLDITLKQATSYRNEYLEGVSKCTLDTTLYELMEKIVRAEVHRLVIVNETEKIVGIISLSDLLQYIVLRPEVEREKTSNQSSVTDVTSENNDPTVVNIIEQSEDESNKKNSQLLDESVIDEGISSDETQYFDVQDETLSPSELAKDIESLHVSSHTETEALEESDIP